MATWCQCSQGYEHTRSENSAVTSSRELVNDLLRGRKAERVGLTEGFWPETLSGWVEQGYPTRMAYKEIGETRWRRADGRWVDV